MSRAARLEQEFRGVFDPQVIEITDESHMHAGPNAETHFKVLLVSQSFEGLSRVKRHQAVYGRVEAEMASGLHAIALHLYTPAEWQVRDAAPESPNCRGGE